MGNRARILKTFCFLVFIFAGLDRGDAQIKESFDSIYYKSVSDSVENYIKKHPNKFKPKENKFVPIPIGSLSYTPEDGVGFIAGMVGQYRNGLDIQAPLSNLSLYSYVSTKGSFKFTVGGINYTIKGDSRLEYKASVFYDKRNFWGIGYGKGIDDCNSSRYNEFGVNISFAYRFLLNPIFDIAPLIGFNYFDAYKFTKEELIIGLPLSFCGVYVGADLNIDTRDNQSSPTKGLHINLSQKVYPKALYNKNTFYQTDISASVYFKAWKGAVFAFDVFSESNFGESPWFLWTPLGGETRMRGYYYGRYRDKNTLTAQLELRQNIYKGHGAVIWGGAGNIFPSYKEIDIKKTLPNYGFGYRYNMGGNIFKLDIGFGANNEWAIMAGFNHAF